MLQRLEVGGALDAGEPVGQGGEPQPLDGQRVHRRVPEVPDALGCVYSRNSMKLALAGTGVALHAKPSVQTAAPHVVNHGDLTALLFLQGYARQEFVDILEVMGPDDPRTAAYRRQLTARLY